MMLRHRRVTHRWWNGRSGRCFSSGTLLGPVRVARLSLERRNKCQLILVEANHYSPCVAQVVQTVRKVRKTKLLQANQEIDETTGLSIGPSIVSSIGHQSFRQWMCVSIATRRPRPPSNPQAGAPIISPPAQMVKGRRLRPLRNSRRYAKTWKMTRRDRCHFGTVHSPVRNNLRIRDVRRCFRCAHQHTTHTDETHRNGKNNDHNSNRSNEPNQYQRSSSRVEPQCSGELHMSTNRVHQVEFKFNVNSKTGSKREVQASRVRWRSEERRFAPLLPAEILLICFSLDHVSN